MIKKKKSQVWVSAVLYTLIAIAALFVVLQVGVPILERMKDKTTFTKTKDVMLNLDKHIQEVAKEGEGSQRIINLEIKDGELIFDTDQIIWEMETDHKIIEPRTETVIGNLLVTSNANAETIETEKFYYLRTQIEDETFEVRINKTGSKLVWAEMNTSKLIDYMSYNGNKINGTFTFGLNNNPDSTYGNGYTEMIPGGNNSNLGRAKVIAHVNSSFGKYDLEIILESYADFISTRIKNFQPK